MKWSSREYLIAFNMISGIGGRRLQNLQKHFPSLKKAWEATTEELLQVPGFGPKIIRGFVNSRGKICPHKEGLWAKRLGAEIITLADEDYPQSLKRLVVPPPVLYVWGKLPAALGFAVVGTRRPSRTGVAQAREFSSYIAKKRVPVISGLARGIDYVAHQQTIAVGGSTVAVLGSNLGAIYPREHEALARKISGQGAVVSEFSSRCPTVPGNFPRRNRIIAGLSQGVLVVQAGKKSGALRTADWALEMGLDVWALPGEIYDPLRVGTNNLIKQGAYLAMNPQELLGKLPSEDPASQSLAQLYKQGLHPNSIAATLGMPISEVLTEISLLQMGLEED